MVREEVLGLQPRRDGSKPSSATVPFLSCGLPVLFFFFFLCTNFLGIFWVSSHVKLKFSAVSALSPVVQTFWVVMGKVQELNGLPHQ